MRLRYGLWDFEREQMEQRLKELLELFNLLLNKTAVNVEQALE